MKPVVLAIALIVFAWFGPVYARTWYVTPDGTGDFPTIADAVSSVDWYDSVLVGCGTYYEHGILIWHELTLVSETGESDCVTINALQQGRVLEIGACVDSATVVKGFTLTGGSSSRGSGMRLYLYASPRLENLVIEGNTALEGGGMWVDEGCLPVLKNVTFSANEASSRGGGLYLYDGAWVRVHGCRFLGNVAGADGGGACLYEGASAVFLDGFFAENSAATQGSAIWCDQMSTLTLDGIEFDGNSTSVIALNVAAADLSRCLFLQNAGPALETFNASPAVSECRFIGNVGGDAGAMVIMGDFPVIENTVFMGNSGTLGGAIYIDSGRPEISRCTLVGNAGGQASAISVVRDIFDPVLIENSILAYGYGGPAVYCWGSVSNPDPALFCCDVYGNEGGNWVGCIADQSGINGNFSACPSFCSPALNDLHLCDGSPCAPGNHPAGYACGLIGALGVGCTCGPSGIEQTTWGSIKSMYR